MPTATVYDKNGPIVDVQLDEADLESLASCLHGRFGLRWSQIVREPVEEPKPKRARKKSAAASTEPKPKPARVRKPRAAKPGADPAAPWGYKADGVTPRSKPGRRSEASNGTPAAGEPEAAA